jgi:hypothetical protein
MDFQEIIAGTVGRENTYGTCVGLVKAGPMSFARFSTDDATASIRGYVGEGEFTDDPLDTFGGAGVVRDSAAAEAAALHLRERLRASRGGQPVDFGTLSVRVSIFDSVKGRLGAGVAEYPLLRKKEDPDHATQSHADHMNALAKACARPSPAAGIEGRPWKPSRSIPPAPASSPSASAWSRSTTTTSGATTAPGKKPPRSPPPRTPAAWRPSTGAAASTLPSGVFAKLLHWLRHNPDKRARFATALEHCDMVAAVLCGITDPAAAPRSICAMGHKWMWNAALGGFPPEDFLAAPSIRCSRACARNSPGATRLPTRSPATCAGVGRKAGPARGHPIPVGAFDAHWDAIGAGVQAGRRGQRGRHVHLHHGDRRKPRWFPACAAW